MEGAASAMGETDTLFGLMDGILEDGQTLFFENKPQFESIQENAECFLADKWLSFKEAFLELNVAWQCIIGFAVGFVFGGLLALIDKGLREVLSQFCTDCFMKLLKRYKHDIPETEIGKKVFGFVNKFITIAVFGIGIVVAPIVFYAVTCSIGGAIAFAAGVTAGAYLMYEYLSQQNDKSKSQRRDSQYRDLEEELKRAEARAK